MAHDHPVDSDPGRSGPAGRATDGARASGGAGPRGGAKSDAGAQSLDFISTMEAQLTALKQARADQDRMAAELLEREAAAARLTHELEERAALLEARDAELRETASKLAQAKDALIERQREAEALAESLRKTQSDLERQRAEHEASKREVAELERALAERQQEVALRGEEAEALRSELEEKLRAVEARAEDGQRQLELKQAELQEMTKSLDAAIEHATQRAGELASEREQFNIERSKFSAKTAERERAVTAMRAELEEARKALHAERKGDAKALGEQAAAATARAEELERKLTALQSDRAGSSRELEQKLAALESERAKAATELAARDERIKALEAGLAGTRADGDANEVLAEMEREVEKRDRAIKALQERVEKAQHERDKAMKQLADAAAQGEPPALASPDSEIVQLRRERLHRYKSLLRDQSSKIMQARSALAKRHEQYEALLAKRAELAAAKVSLEKVSAKVEKSQARNKSAVASLCIVIAVAILGALSWTVSERVFPATYLVQATVEAQAEGKELTPERLQGWQQSMEQLALDPRLMEIVADRMKKRGVVELQAPSAVADRLKSDLDVTSGRAGEVTFSLRGEGAERTRRVLETYLASFIVVANDTRDRRMDQATTIASSRPAPDPKPIERPQILYAGAIWGVASAAFLLCFVVGWMKLSSVKRKFDETEPSLRSLDSGAWPSPPSMG